MRALRYGVSVLCAGLLAIGVAFGDATTAKDIKVIPSGGKSDAPGDVVVTWEGGRSERLTKGAHVEQAKLGPDGLIGWVWSKERVQRGKQLAFEIKSGKPFIEDWAFAKEGIVVKSRAMHGPALIELFSLTDGKTIETITKAFGPDLPAWAKPFNDD
jgi:hypothetical protein